MKARIKATGEVVDVYYETQHGTAMTTIYKEATLVNGRTFTDKDIEIMNESQLEEHSHWQDVRERAAIAAMQGTMSLLGSDKYAFSEIVVEGYSGIEKTYPKEIAEFAVACADALVEQLKKKEQ